MRRPELFGACVVAVPKLDLLRFPRFTGGSYSIPELGDPEDEGDYRVLASYSPYHNVDAETAYPPVLVLVGERDATSPPLHGYKFIARVQSEGARAAPALLKVMWGAGHDFGTEPAEVAANWADAWAFVIAALRLEGGD